MKSCTIIISHYESLPFLRACISQIVKNSHPEIETYIIVCDQSKSQDAENAYGGYWGKDVTHFKYVHTAPLYSGFGIDWIMRNVEINTDYICQIHCDAFPISKNWLLLPIALIEENNLSFVGQLQTINTNAHIYPPNPFFAMAQCYNVARTETYKELSLKAGFTRFHNRLQSELTFENDDWQAWASEDYNARGSDDDIVAFSWQDRYKNDNKLGLAITGFIAPAYGRIIEDIVFHFGSCRESIGTGDAMGKEYADFTRRINEGYSDELISEMLELANNNKPPEMEILTRNFWDGKLKKSSPTSDELNKRIEELKQC